MERAIEQDPEDVENEYEEHEAMERLFGVFAAHDLVLDVQARVPGVT